MQRRATGGRKLIFGAVLAFSLSALVPAATAASASHHPASHAKRHLIKPTTAHKGHTRGKRAATRTVSTGISCVPFARSHSGIDVPGNARDWWDNAAGLYARGSVPQPGSVLAFRANARMPLGHVAVVRKLINRREVEVDQANWGRPRGAVSRGVAVVDVSEDNDWSAVRVEMGDSSQFGAVYPTYGFIYDRADTGTMIAAAITPAPTPALNPVTVDLRPAGERYNEVAEAPGPDTPVSHAPYRVKHVFKVNARHHRTTTHHRVSHKP